MALRSAGNGIGGGGGGGGSATPSGPAGGDLAGTYPNPTVAQASGLNLFSDGANIDGMRNGAAPQSYRVYNTYTSAANNEYVSLDWVTGSTQASLLTKQTGAGTARSLLVGTSGAASLFLYSNGVGRWTVSVAGSFNPFADITYDIGTSALRVKNAYVAAALVLGSQVVTAAVTLTSASPYRTIGNSATAFTQAVPASPLADETRVFTNVGAGTMTISYTGRAGAATRALAQDAAVTMAFNSTLGYWTTE